MKDLTKAQAAQWTLQEADKVQSREAAIQYLKQAREFAKWIAQQGGFPNSAKAHADLIVKLCETYSLPHA